VIEALAAEPLALRIWVAWLVAINTASVLFVWKRVEARWVLLAWTLVIPLMGAMHAVFGYARILGVAHIAVWAPLVVWLWMRRDGWRALESPGDKWIALVLLSNAVSLGFDYVDLVRFLAGRLGAG
jgi:hypothetical protein